MRYVLNILAATACASLMAFATGPAAATQPTTALAPAPPAVAKSAERCFADWSEAAPVVRREALAPAASVHEQARANHVGDLVRITLCEAQGKYVYHLVVREAKGRIVSMVVDAKKPF